MIGIQTKLAEQFCLGTNVVSVSLEKLPAAILNISYQLECEELQVKQYLFNTNFAENEG